MKGVKGFGRIVPSSVDRVRGWLSRLVAGKTLHTLHGGAVG